MACLPFAPILLKEALKKSYLLPALGLDGALFATATFQIQTAKACSEKRQGHWLGNGIARCHREGDAVVPEVAIGIETKRHVVAVVHICCQRLQLGSSEVVDEIPRISSKALHRQEGVSRTRIDERIAVVERAGEVVDDLAGWHGRSGRVRKGGDAGALGRIKQVDEKHVGVSVPVADVFESYGGASNFLALQTGVIDSPCIGPVMIEIDLIGTTAARVRGGSRGAKGDSVRQRCCR